jgi:hypothetical protein
VVAGNTGAAVVGAVRAAVVVVVLAAVVGGAVVAAVVAEVDVEPQPSKQRVVVDLAG